ncbi:3'(2'),5'-bisphosphate nucleotidase CysQ [Helicobacter sp. faydin-H20]|uniref:3'(2'),5'-bisphosphate nucleotidase CysQ family protein n=1 Tax=Helicobacter anatolicus TaxID=2905874 RepID=UPI001E514D3E|nr:3'(2'),5'-bisphosphate nucleotidase CysQ [Helicobacter anatolicus]MCE3037124.1 3'(2'),5'-bisphosphate nucleotidase CysQ [Helicobacter anatolicus]
MKNKKDLLFEVLMIAIDAGRAILPYYGNEDYECKEDLSPITQADKAANKVILEGLKKISNYPICSEESELEYEKRKNLDFFWLVDPLDGTKDFLAQNRQFSVNIALISHNSSTLGVVYAPILDEAYIAYQGFGAYKITQCRDKTLQDLHNSLIKIPQDFSRTRGIACDSVHHSVEKMQNFIKYYDLECKKLGSALKFCALATNEADFYLRVVGTKEWDSAAGQIILEESGGLVLSYEEKTPLPYNKENIKNKDFMAFGIRALQKDGVIFHIYRDFKNNLGFFSKKPN